MESPVRWLKEREIRDKFIMQLFSLVEQILKVSGASPRCVYSAICDEKKRIS